MFFAKNIDEKKFKCISRKERNEAFNKGMNYISKQNLIINEEEEFIYFLEYYD